MKALKSACMLLACIFAGTLYNQIVAQDFSPAYDQFSKSHPMYVLLEDGTELEGTLDKITRKKNQIESVAMKDANGNIRKLSADEIKHIYLKPSSVAKMNTDMLNAAKISTWDNTYLKGEIMKLGYSYFEKAKVELKNETTTLLLQLLNPGFSNKIKVFYDPYAAETGGFGIGELQLTGGEDKSYYVQVGNNIAKRTKKKDYENLYKEFYAGCPTLLQKLEKELKWADFAKHIYSYSFDCK